VLSTTADFALPAPGASAELLLPGPAGRIEGLLAAPARALATPAVALVCHPHPLFGGALNNKVAYTLAAAALKAGAHALRFNFRGVGRSEGLHDEGRGETEDVVFLAEVLRQRLPGARLLLAGFSFGAFVSLQASARVAPQLQVSVAPPFGKYFGNAPLPARPPCPWLVIHGRDDEVVSFEATRAILEGYAPPPRLVVTEGSGHFFHGQLGELSATVLGFIQEHWT
jgi:alpha/beta superfamily hydrolase